MRLINHLYTRSEVKMNEGLEGGSRHVISKPRNGICYFRLGWPEGNPRWLGHRRHGKEIEEAQTLETSSSMFKA